MKRTAILLALLLTASCAVQHDLTTWKIQREGDSVSYTVKAPCTVAGALNEAGALGTAVLEKDNYKSIDKSPFDSPWTFTARFGAKPGLKHVLRIPGIGYRADIWLNGTQIASSDTTFGVFSAREWDITRIAKKLNVLKIKVHRAQSGDLNHGYVDWNPRPLDETMGLIRKPELISTRDVQIEDVFVKPVLDPSDLSRADLQVEVTLINRSDSPVEGILEGGGKAGSFNSPVALDAGERKVLSFTLHVNNPRIWWTAEMGEPYMYKLLVSFRKGEVVSSFRTVPFGIRSIESRIDENGHLQFTLNGKDVLIKAGGWTDDIFQQDTRESILSQLRLVRNMGLNCIRFENIWGKDDVVYEACDSLGILALVGWSCQWEWQSYCGLPETRGYGCINTPRTEDLAVRYFRDQLIRLRNHPSIIGWLTGSDFIPNPRLEQRYMELYRKLEYRPYVCSAKNIKSTVTGPSGTKMAGPYEYVGPDYWYLDTRFGGAFGFNTETGVGMNIPQFESVRRMVGEENMWPLNGVWDFHCTASTTDMNTTRVAFAEAAAQYGEPTDAEDFVRKAHALDYDATRAMFEAFRCNVPRTTGIVQWMLNSAWPSLYWQLYDWYLVPTAGYYGTQKACAPQQLVFNYADRCVWAVDDVQGGRPLTARMMVYGPDSRLRRTEESSIKVSFREPQKVFSGIEGPCFVFLELRDASGNPVADNFYCIPGEQNEYLWDKSEWYITPIGKHSDMSFVSALPQTTVNMQSVATGDGFDVTLTNSGGAIAYQNIVKAKDASGELIPSVLWSDNFVSLAPGQSRTLHCTIPAGSGPATISLDGWNATVSLSAPDSLDRNRSKYAVYNFTDDDRYTGTLTHETVNVSQPKGNKVKNIIMMIGDGMGYEQISCGWVVNGGHLNMDAMPYLGASRTFATDRLITDSCAGGNALSTGVKTKYGYIGLDSEQNPLESALMLARAKGKKTGVTVTCRINDATPADYVGHSPTRKDEEGLAAQYVGSGLDFISGGGLHFWTSRSDGRNLVEEMKALGYTFVDRLEDIAAAPGDKFLGLYGEYDLPHVSERGPVLLESTLKALKMLDNKKGFFLMVEGSQIDDWAHRNKVGHMCEELLDFDRTLGAVLEFAARDGQTLVVVTADHATGGLTLLGGSLEEKTVKVNYSTKGHNGIVVPVFAFGPHAEDFAGVHDNAEIGQLICRLIK